MGVMDGVLPLPPPVGGEQQEAEGVAPAAVRTPRLEHRVVREIVEERVHAREEDRRDQTEGDRDWGAWLGQGGQHPDGEVRQDDTRDLPEAALAVDLEVRGEVLLPALAGWDACGLHGDCDCHPGIRAAVNAGSRTGRSPVA
jgi:hypothetical protein